MDLVRKSRADVDENIPRIPDPCLAQGTTKEVNVPQANGKMNLVLIAGENIGSFGVSKHVLNLVVENCVVFLDTSSYINGRDPLPAYYSNLGLSISAVSQLAKQI